ncbi:MAG: hypothetical protein GEEBNDBF_00749 [bacterium]|nr:hypothetical protein [bacterium]
MMHRDVGTGRTGKRLAESWIALIALVILVGPASAAPGGQRGEAPGSGPRMAPGGPREQGPRLKPLLIEVVEFLLQQGISTVSGLSEERRESLAETFREQKITAERRELATSLIKALVETGIRTPKQVATMTPEARRVIMEAIRPPQPGPDADRRPRPALGGGPEGMRGPHQGPSEGGPGGMLLDRLAERMLALDITDLSNVSEKQKLDLFPGPDRDRDRGPGREGDNREGRPEPPRGQQPPRGPGNREEGRPDPRGGFREPVGMVIDWLMKEGVTNLRELSEEELRSLQQAFFEAHRPGPPQGAAESGHRMLQ